MELFKNTNYDFLGKKWPFIIASLVLTVAGFASIVMQGGLKFGIDFKGGTLMTVKFAQKPPLEEIRKAFARSGKIKGEVTVQSITDPQTQNEVEIGTELVNERQLAAIYASRDRRPALPIIGIPTAILHGDSDNLIDPAGAKELHHLIPASTLTIYPGMGHSLPRELWDEIVNNIRINASGNTIQ